MAKILAIVNIKGGVGKTTTAINLAAALTERGRAVLAIDLDPQASLTYSLGLDPASLENTVADVLNGRIATMSSVIVSTLEKFDVAPSSHTLMGITLEQASDPGRITIVKESLEPLRELYDYILIDCPAQAGFLTNIALIAADQVLIPFTPDFLNYKALEWLMSIIRKIQGESNPNLRVAGIFYSMLDLRTRHAREVSKLVEKTFGSDVPVLSAVIGQTVAIRNAAMASKSIFEYAPDSPVVESYRTLARELEEGVQQQINSELPTVLTQGREALQNHNLADAYVAFRRATELNPRLPNGWVGRAESASKWSESIECYARALELEPREQTIRENLAALVKNTIASANRSDAADLVTSAQHLAQIEQNDLAESLLVRATELDPKNDKAWLARARLSKDGKDIVAFANRCLEINPKNDQAQAILSIAKQRLGDETKQIIEQADALLKDGQRLEAHAKYRLAAELDPLNDVAWLGVARTAEPLRERLEYAQKALKVNPRNEEALEFYSLLHSFMVAPNETIESMPFDWMRLRWVIPLIIIVAVIIIVVLMTLRWI